ncbi:MAG: CPBP family intramembrane metalloprotease [Myxococcales bacterium]|nr:CPBP family intramembrane metalloprotease [Myxococcales bacterium]
MKVFPARFGHVESFILLLVTVGLLATAGGLLQLRFGFFGLALTELLVVAAPMVVAAWAFQVRPEALGLRRASPRALLGGLLVGAGGFYLVAAVLEWGMEKIAPLPPALREQMRRLIVPEEGPRPLIVDLAVLALLPAVCEELLFRGALLESWRPAGRIAAVGGAALAFGGFHLSMYKLVPTVALGALAGVVALRAASVAPAMVLHFVNNTLVVVLVRAGHEDPPPPDSVVGALLCALSVAAVAGGIKLTGRRGGAR